MKDKPAVCLEMNRIELYIDGSCEPCNPGGNGVAGAYLCYGLETEGRSRQLGRGPKMSNNVAEYEGLLLGLELCLEKGINENFIIYSDSMLVINQMLGNWKMKGGLYAQSYFKARQFFDKHFKITTIEIEWVSSAENPADAYTRELANA